MSFEVLSCEFSPTFNEVQERKIDFFVENTGIILVASTGNYLQHESSEGYVCAPARSGNVISVGSIDENGTPSSFSSYFSNNGIENNPTISAVGENRLINGFTAVENGEQISLLEDGTSQSAASVTGAIALLLQRYKDLHENDPSYEQLTPYEVSSILGVTADDSIINTNPELIYYTDASGYFIANNLYDISIGMHPRTGSGALDISNLLQDNYSFGSSTMISIAANQLLESHYIYLDENDELTFSYSWQHYSTMDTLEDNININIEITTTDGTLFINTSSDCSTQEILRFTALDSQYYVVKIRAINSSNKPIKTGYAYIIES